MSSLGCRHHFRCVFHNARSDYCNAQWSRESARRRCSVRVLDRRNSGAAPHGSGSVRLRSAFSWSQGCCQRSACWRRAQGTGCTRYRLRTLLRVRAVQMRLTPVSTSEPCITTIERLLTWKKPAISSLTSLGFTKLYVADTRAKPRTPRLRSSTVALLSHSIPHTGGLYD